ncbi:MAG: amidohydrolase family protein [Myxococcota bacterium]
MPCSVIVVDSPGGKEEALELRIETPAILAAAGVPVALHTDDPITDSRLFLRAGGLAVRGGMPEDQALAALTLNGAKMLGLQERVGSLEPGKDADLVVLSGPPLSVWTHVEQTWVEGQKVFDRSDPMDQRYATGGWDVLQRYPAPAEASGEAP